MSDYFADSLNSLVARSAPVVAPLLHYALRRRRPRDPIDVDEYGHVVHRPRVGALGTPIGWPFLGLAAAGAYSVGSSLLGSRTVVSNFSQDPDVLVTSDEEDDLLLHPPAPPVVEEVSDTASTVSLLVPPARRRALGAPFVHPAERDVVHAVRRRPQLAFAPGDAPPVSSRIRYFARRPVFPLFPKFYPWWDVPGRFKRHRTDLARSRRFIMPFYRRRTSRFYRRRRSVRFRRLRRSRRSSGIPRTMVARAVSKGVSRDRIRPAMRAQALPRYVPLRTLRSTAAVLKWTDTNQTFTDFPRAGDQTLESVWPINYLTVAHDDNHREGDRVTWLNWIYEIKIIQHPIVDDSGTFVLSPGAAANINFAGTPAFGGNIMHNTYHIALVYDSRPTSTLPLYTDIFTGYTSAMFPNVSNRLRFRTLWDKRFTLRGSSGYIQFINGPNLLSGYPLWGDAPCEKSLCGDVGLGLSTTYKPNAVGSGLGDFDRGTLYLVVASDGIAAAGNQGYQLSFTSRLTFLDADMNVGTRAL